MLAEDIAKLMTMVPLEEKTARTEGKDKIEGGAFDGVLDKKTPFMFKESFRTFQSPFVSHHLGIVKGGSH